LSNFSKEFYHWLAVSGNEAQRLALGSRFFCVAPAAKKKWS